MFRRTLVPALAALCISGSAMAQTIVTDGDVMAIEKFEGTVLAFEFEKLPKEAFGLALGVVGPKGYAAKVPSEGMTPRLDLRKYGELADGIYSYELSGSTGEKIALPKEAILNNGREQGPSKVSYAVFRLSGQFLVDRGRIVLFDPDQIDKTDPGKDGENPPWKDGDDREEFEPSGKVVKGKPGDEPRDGDKG